MMSLGQLIAVIGDEDTCVGFLLGGIGEINKDREKNFLVVDKDTTVQEINQTFKKFVKRYDIAIILITQPVANMIRETIEAHVKAIPAVLEIPSKDQPYDVTKDYIMRRAKGMFSPEK